MSLLTVTENNKLIEFISKLQMDICTDEYAESFVSSLPKYGSLFE